MTFVVVTNVWLLGAQAGLMVFMAEGGPGYIFRAGFLTQGYQQETFHGLECPVSLANSKDGEGPQPHQPPCSPHLPLTLVAE